MCPAATSLSENEGSPVSKRLKWNHNHHPGQPSTDSSSERRFEKKIRVAKRASRSELSVSKGEWNRHGYYASLQLHTNHDIDSTPRIDARSISSQEFINRYEGPSLPVVLTHVCDDWPAFKGAWTEEALLEKYSHYKFKVGSDDDGYGVRLKLKYFLKYCRHPQHGVIDDSPLYLFDSSFGEKDETRNLVDDYSLPSFFNEDLMSMVGERRRPPYRWIVIGPARSGTYCHVDPLATSAWNALISGRKLWAIFPPGCPKELVKPRGVESEASSWFAHVYPRTKSPEWPGGFAPQMIIQKPGEVVFVPGGCYHAVINLDMSIAVTQNFCSTTNFPSVWRHTKRGRPKMSIRWLRVLKTTRPDLASQAAHLDDAHSSDYSTSSSSSSSSSSSESDNDEEEEEEK